MTDGRHVPNDDSAALIYDWNDKDRRGPVLRKTSIVSSTSTDNGLGMDADNNDCRTDRPRLSGAFTSDVTRATATGSDVSAAARPLSTLSTTSVDTGIYSEPGDCAANKAAAVGGDVNDVNTGHHEHQHVHDVTTADGEFSSEQHF